VTLRNIRLRPRRSNLLTTLIKVSVGGSNDVDKLSTKGFINSKHAKMLQHCIIFKVWKVEPKL
jgi:hypothetical protein